ncbi:MAG: hypothetical protein JJV97_03135 [SAR324 cluster bacterium]|nr:hypothetical protein [SAR324 cluster bacterium]
MSKKLIKFILLGGILILSNGYFVKSFATNELLLASWNLQNMMSQQHFVVWKKYCSAHNWKPTNKRPPILMYCDAHNGYDFFTKQKAYLTLHSWDKFKLKINALKEKSHQINADIYAIQEITDLNALKLILDEDDYHLMATNYHISQNIAFAIRKKANLNPKFKLITELAIQNPKNKNQHLTRPGLEVTISPAKTTIKILNIHLKAGCKNYIIDGDKLAGRFTDRIARNCQILRKQIIGLRKWISDQNRQKIPFLIMGDFNRLFSWELREHYRHKKPARLAGSDNLDAKSPITDKTRLAYMFFALNESDRFVDRLMISFADRKVGKYLKRGRCLYGNNYFINSIRLANKLVLADGSDKTSGLVKIRSYERDYGDKHYGPTKALPSDHCLLYGRITFE